MMFEDILLLICYPSTIRPVIYFLSTTGSLHTS